MCTCHTQRRRHRPGFSLLELLVVLAVIGLLFSLLLPVFHQARLRASRTVSMSNLKQIGVAFRLYQNDWNRRPWQLHDLHPDYVPDARLLASPADPFLPNGGWASVVERRAEPDAGRWRIPVSYAYPQLLARSDRYWQLAKRQKGRPGYVVDVVYGEQFDNERTYYTGTVLRLCFDGSVITTQVAHRRHEVNYWKLCTDQEEPPE